MPIDLASSRWYQGQVANPYLDDEGDLKVGSRRNEAHQRTARDLTSSLLILTCDGTSL
jgi:hypothetical protein